MSSCHVDLPLQAAAGNRIPRVRAPLESERHRVDLAPRVPYPVRRARQAVIMVG
jgi:hypothetical protein